MNVAIIDIGSARIKLTISTTNKGEINIMKLKEETHLSSYVSNDNYIDESYISSDFTKILTKINSVIHVNKCDKVIIVGTHIFRIVKNSNIIVDKIESILGKMTILESWIEGALFYKRLKEMFTNDNIATIDIGGGSVQICLSDKKYDVYSIQSGTFSLEKLFQSNQGYATEEELAKMSKNIKEAILQIPEKKIDVIVMGSNCMFDFISSAFNNSRILNEFKPASRTSLIHKSSVITLFNEIKCIKYDELRDYFPKNPYFMFGADKALLNLLLICDYFCVDNVLATNESVSSAMLELLQSNPDELLRYNISINSPKNI